jgi:hypothetical protein
LKMSATGSIKKQTGLEMEFSGRGPASHVQGSLPSTQSKGTKSPHNLELILDQAGGRFAPCPPSIGLAWREEMPKATEHRGVHTSSQDRGAGGRN